MIERWSRRGCADLTEVLVWAGRLREATGAARRGLAYLEADSSADRSRLLAGLGRPTPPAGDYESTSEALDEH